MQTGFMIKSVNNESYIDRLSENIPKRHYGHSEFTCLNDNPRTKDAEDFSQIAFCITQIKRF